ncbi:hypothetical protein C4544_06000 [candidate division WS5 bacterium]|uniref:CN hydrolase domain-containing protein n=1 Tax=candidate division WS5 bacterium TaxID=2093353 RepID=A0A419DAU4_9BACT|nr:MAG: hypothetical protein C4544_06000 [candidate division WS5 bacterium]
MAIIKPYTIAVMQASKIQIRSGGMAKFKKNVKTNLNHYCALIDGACRNNSSVKLVTFGEFTITGQYAPADLDDHEFNNKEILENTAIRIPGPETDVFASKAEQYGIYIAAANFEYDPDWPNIHFNTAFIISPEGEIILKYRKLMGQAASVHDIMDKYVNPLTKKYDPFPVVDTRIGRLACIVCTDMYTPELTRIYGMKGAEVILRLTAGWGMLRAPGVGRAVAIARASDNGVYFVVSNWGPYLGTQYAAATSAGHSCVINYEGRVIEEALTTNEIVLKAQVDIEALRDYKRRRDPIRLIRTELYLPYYRRTIFPPNTLLGTSVEKLDSRERDTRPVAMENVKKNQDFYNEYDVMTSQAKAKNNFRQRKYEMPRDD